MKKLLLRTVIFSVICCLCIHCTQSSIVEISPKYMNDRQLLEYLGYDTHTMIERDEYYLLAPNTVILKEDIPELRNNPQTRMQRGYGLLSEEYQTIYVNDDGISDYANLLAEAVEEWNKILNSNIEFVFDNTASLVVNFVGDYAGDQFDPVSIQNPSSSGQYGKTVVFNYSKALPLLSDPTRGKYYMMHILGHIVGFGHAVTDPFAMPDGKFINGTTVSDTESIMRSENDILNGRNGEKWIGFSKWDIKAIQFIYPPKEKPSFTFDCVPAGTGTDGLTLAMGTTYTFTAKYVFSSCPNPKYQVTVKKTSGLGASEYELKETGNGIYTIKFTKPGSYKVSAKVTNATQANLIEKTYHVYALDPYLTAPQDFTLGQDCTFTVKFDYPNSVNPPYTISVIPPESENDYAITEQKNTSFNIRFNTQGAYKILVNRNPAGNTQTASCDLYVYFRPYMKAEKIVEQQDNITRYKHRVRFYSDEGLTSPAELYEGFEFTWGLYYKGLFRQGVKIDKNVGPISSGIIRLDNMLFGFYNEKGYLELPDCEESVEVIPQVGGSIRGKCYMKQPYYTLTIPENSCVVHNPVY